jgi:adenine-specific DNA-methyltransferase
MITDFQAKYFAHELTRRQAPDDAERMASAVAGAQVDLNPHQVDAALFAFASPFSKGALLADEVGLGKTIEAGLVISQRWAERKRSVLVIAPSNLRKQWYQELTEKFFLNCAIIEAKSYNQAVKAGHYRPFAQENAVVICSYQFARSRAADVGATPWDLVVIDEAHRLRNVYKPSNVIANELKRVLAGKQKLLLTATPLQNSLLELYGLVSFIDEYSFGDLKSFRDQFMGAAPDRVFTQLRDRLKPICHRTLRRQVTTYVPYTKRFPIVEEFTPEESEDRLYQLVSDYLRRENLQALPSGQRSLMTLVLRKLLASSSFAIAGALNSIARRLRDKLADDEKLGEVDLGGDYEALDETADEWEEDDIQVPLSEGDRRAIAAEIADLDGFATLATSIEENAKGKALLKALKVAFAKADELGAAHKAIIFTESRRTQAYLLRLLGESPYRDGIVLFNGTNMDEASKAIYNAWYARYKDTDRITGSRSADMRSALVDYFREQGRIMIATEAGAEGINLQFCSLVVNYDLPWNPQRIEQRIGRCHRYGQKHDVVVVNFINRKNEADKRVYELLSEKFKLFEGVFGASDEVLGVIESGVDFEKRISGIYQQCRQTDQIKAAFDQLQRDMSLEINQAMSQTRQKLLENFDEEVMEKLKTRDAESKIYLRRFEEQLLHVTRHELAPYATFPEIGAFALRECPPWADPASVPLGLYELPRRSVEAHLFRISHPLGEAIMTRAKEHELVSSEVSFNFSGHPGKISALEPLRGQSGWLIGKLYTIEALDAPEDHILLAAEGDDGSIVSTEATKRMLGLPAAVGQVETLPAGHRTSLEAQWEAQASRVRQANADRNVKFFEAEAEKLECWADDLKLGLEREIKEIDRQIKEARRAALAALGLEDKLAGQKQIKTLEHLRSTKRRNLFDAQDEIDRQRGVLIAQIEEKLAQKIEVKPLFTIRWRLV